MSLSSMLASLKGDVNGKIDDIDRKIQRLKLAKQKVENEQDTMLEEIRQLKKPDLNNNWVGQRADEFDGKRDEVYLAMSYIGNLEYGQYQSSIQNKINLLQIEKTSLHGIGSLVGEASKLFELGEDMYDDVTNKIAEIKRML
ncbi:YwqH-like family protein [Niallia taxi]|uniref:YwqH-like family protein n=1 Tax=Niallia taxi TaxID=2499688 RepID=UPI003D285D96